MKITSNSKEVLISLPKDSIDKRDLQDIIDFLRYKIIVSNSKASLEEIDSLCREIDQKMGEVNEVFVKP